MANTVRMEAGTDRLMQRPIYGGVFGKGRYALASMPCVSRGLHKTVYMVLQPDAGAVLCVAEDKVEALAGARRLISANMEEEGPEQMELMLVPREGQASPSVPEPILLANMRVPRRRREIFERSQGKCHYCGTVLRLDGQWHIEHQLPRALGGGDDPLNLVAACVPCNLRKSDRTAIEFVASGELR